MCKEDFILGIPLLRKSHIIIIFFGIYTCEYAMVFRYSKVLWKWIWLLTELWNMSVSAVPTVEADPFGGNHRLRYLSNDNTYWNYKCLSLTMYMYYNSDSYKIMCSECLCFICTSCETIKFSKIDLRWFLEITVIHARFFH